jgi:hypothetical protein
VIIGSYSSLLEAVGFYLDNPKLTPHVNGFVQNWEERFYRDPKNFGRWMETSLNSTIASDVVAVPSDYLALKYAYVVGAPSSRLDRMSINQMYGTFPRGGSTDVPAWIAREGANFVFGPEPDDAYQIHLLYWAKPDLLRVAETTNDHWLIVNAPDLPLYGALLEAQPFILSDARVPLWGSLYESALEAYRDLHTTEDESGSPIQEVLA